MTRHFFRFVVDEGDTVGLTTTDKDLALKIMDAHFAQNSSFYFTPWMEFAADDADEPMPGTLGRVNLVRVLSMGYYTKEMDDRG